MSTQDEMKAAHLAMANARWDQAIKGARHFFQYMHGNAEHAAKVRKLAYALFTSRNLFDVLGGQEYGFGITMDGYVGYSTPSVVERLEFIRYFIGHEILDDGDAGLAFYRYAHDDGDDPSEPFVRCGSDHPEARPYFHRSTELLRQDYPEANHLCVETALEALAYYEARIPKRADARQRVMDFQDRYTDEDIAREIECIVNGTVEEKALVALATELREM